MNGEQHSFVTRLLRRTAKVEPAETTAVVTAFLLYFCVLGGYFAVRPVRETVGTVMGAERVADAWVITWIVSIAIVPIYGALASRFRRSTFLPWIYGFVAISLAICALLLRSVESAPAVGQFFYVFISVVNLFVVSVFWSFLLELFNANQTKRLFGIMAAGGTTGALVGPMLTDLTVGRIGNSGVLFLGASMFVIAILCQRVLLRIWRNAAWAGTGERAEERPIGGNPFAGFTLVLRSPYLLGIALFVVLLASVNTFLYLQQLRIVTDTFPDIETRTQVFSRIDYTVQSLTVILQLLFTGRLALRFGVGILLTAVPVLMVLGLLLLASFHSFGVLAAVMIARRVGEYAFVRPGREMLFSRVDTETKYKAKNTIDVPVYRGGDALSSQVETGLVSGGMPLTGVAVLGAAVAAVWAVVGFMLGRARRDQEAEPPREPSVAGVGR